MLETGLTNTLFKNESNASLICSLVTGSTINPEALWTMMQQLRKRILILVNSGFIKDSAEHEKLNYLLSTKRWNPYCIRHSESVKQSIAQDLIEKEFFVNRSH